MENLNNLKVLDEIDFDKVIFLIGSSDHHQINKNVTMGLDLNVYPTKQILNYLEMKIKIYFFFFNSSTTQKNEYTC